MRSLLLRREAPQMPIVPDDIRARLTVSPLQAEHSDAFRVFRLSALQREGKYLRPFGEEHKHSMVQWQQRCSDHINHRIFGLFEDDRIIGALAAMKWDDPEWPEHEKGYSVLWGSAYLNPEYRGMKMMVPLYRAREEWTKAHPHFKRAVFFIRDGNARPREIHEKHGAEFMYVKTTQWADGSTGSARWYQRKWESR